MIESFVSRASLCGLINLDKPSGMTSRDAVNVVQRLVRPAKVGHAGTLDPLATGVLVVCLGTATRLIPYLQDQRKTYRATFRFGVSSESHDLECEPVPLEQAPQLTRSQIEQAVPEFVGTIEQIPPVYSAVHVAGRRAYDLARKGKSVELAPRTVEIDRLELIRFDEARQEADFEIVCGSGTYIRSLGRDLAIRLGTAAVMTALRRTAVGSFRVNDAHSPKRLDAASLTDMLSPPQAALEQLPRVELDDAHVAALRQGQFVERPSGRAFSDGESVAVFSADARLVAVARFEESDATLRPKIVFPAT